MQVTCTRRGSDSELYDFGECDASRGLGRLTRSVEDGYVPVCPGCQYAEWHPLCESLVDFDGERLDLHKIPREEIVWSRVSRCEYLDLTVSWIGDEDEPDSWDVPRLRRHGLHRCAPRLPVLGAQGRVVRHGGGRELWGEAAGS